MINNPVLPGFHPDPSIVRVGEEYFLATSTFEWFPGVRIYHSTDLASWRLIATPLDTSSYLDMRGTPDSCGVWAPCLTHDGNNFWLVFSNVKSFDGIWKDSPNFITTATDIRGPWTAPVFLSSMGFDGSLFHDDDGRKWYLSMLVDHRKGLLFGGIVLQEYDPIQRKLTGEVFSIFSGSELGKTEGPHLYKKDGYYYLITAEGGTEYGHAVSIARSRFLKGPYEIHPQNPILSAKDDPDHSLQKTGHADLVENLDGTWNIVFLTGRPLRPLGRCIRGRETGIETIEWRNDGWPVLGSGSRLPRLSIPSELGSERKPEIEEIRFREHPLPGSYQSLRIPMNKSWLSEHERPGYLRMYGRESLSSLFEQSLVARRVQSLQFSYRARLDFRPENFQQMAGIICYYNTGHYHYLHVYGDDGKRWINGITADNHFIDEWMDEPLVLPDEGDLMLGIHWDQNTIQAWYQDHDGNVRKIGGMLDASILSDDYVIEGGSRYRAAFTGAFVGICCQDLGGGGICADFREIAYVENAANPGSTQRSVL